MSIATAIEAEIAALRAKHDRAFQADVAKLKNELSRAMSGLNTKTDKAAAVQPTAPAKLTPVAPTTGNGHKTKAVKARHRNRKGKGVIKYRDPSNPTHTWTGFGRAPSWLKGKEAMFAVAPQTA